MGELKTQRDIWPYTNTKICISPSFIFSKDDIDNLMQIRRNFTTLAVELRLFCIKPWICRYVVG